MLAVCCLQENAQIPNDFKGFRTGCFQSRLSPSGACAHRWKPTWIVAKIQAFLQRSTAGFAGSSRVPWMILRMPAGSAVCCIQENALISKDFKGFRPGCFQVQRSHRAAPGRVVQKDNEFPRFPKVPAMHVSASKGRFHLLSAGRWSTAQGD